jgi:hypothetical protein
VNALEKLSPLRQIIARQQNEAKVLSESLRIANENYAASELKLNALKYDHVSLVRDLASLTQSIINSPGGEEVLLRMQLPDMISKSVDYVESKTAIVSASPICTVKEDLRQGTEKQFAKISPSPLNFTETPKKSSNQRDKVIPAKPHDTEIVDILMLPETYAADSLEKTLSVSVTQTPALLVETSAKVVSGSINVLSISENFPGKATTEIDSLSVATGGVSMKLGLPALNPKRNNSIIVRDIENDYFVVVKRATGPEVYSVVEKRILALGMIAHFTKGKENPANVAGSKTDNSPTGTGKVSSGEKASEARNRKIPNPPPLPDTWPPSFIYGKSELKASSGIAGGALAAAMLASGTSAAKTGPKTKQVKLFKFSFT